MGKILVGTDLLGVSVRVCAIKNGGGQERGLKMTA
jgi:hypothetical protein